MTSVGTPRTVAPGAAPIPSGPARKAPTTASRPRKRRRPLDEIITYVVTVTAWDRHWSFRVSDGSRWELGPYGGHGTLTLHGQVYRPEGFKYPRAEVTLSGRLGMRTERDTSTSIGSLDARDDLLRAYVFVPAEDMAELTVLTTSGRLQMAALSGTPLRYRQGQVRGLSLHTDFDPEEW